MATKVGVCELRWERESQEILESWLRANPAKKGALVVGGGRKKREGLSQWERAMKSMCYVLRHGSGTPECPITEEGWVRWQDVVSHESCRRFGERVLWEAVETDSKDRVVTTPDNAGCWWLAAWSGHTQERVIGPAAVVPRAELPERLVHGSYIRHSASIQRKGLLRRSRDIHLHDPQTNSGKWRLDLETRVEVDVQRACDAGCTFRKTGNEVWLCDRDIPVNALIGIQPWADPGESASGSSQAAGNSGALHGPRRTGEWHPKHQARPVTEEVACTAKDLSRVLPGDLPACLEVDPAVGTVQSVGTEARFAPGTSTGEFDCDWSADESEYEVVQALAASEGESEGEELRPSPAVGSASASDPKVVEALGLKGEEILEETLPQARRRKIKFGSAHLLLLRAVAAADTANWESLQTAIQAAKEPASVKSGLVQRLGELAELRVQSLVGAERKAKEHAERAKRYSEQETEYQTGLNEEMKRLEQMNPVGPRSSVPLISDARLQQDISAGKPTWQARRDHRARQRAASHRQEEKASRSQPRAGVLLDANPEEGGRVLDASLDGKARANLAEFKQILREEARQERQERKRQPDSEQRKKLKKQRRREKGGNVKDDAERDRNHAIAHGSKAGIPPGLKAIACLSLLPSTAGKDFSA